MTAAWGQNNSRNLTPGILYIEVSIITLPSGLVFKILGARSRRNDLDEDIIWLRRRVGRKVAVHNFGNGREETARSGLMGTVELDSKNVHVNLKNYAMSKHRGLRSDRNPQ
jgi:hypothetical protein